MAVLRGLYCLFLMPSWASNWAAATPQAHETPALVDYLIIGGGPSGFVVAEYLSRDPRVGVTLLEAGPDLDSEPDIDSK